MANNLLAGKRGIVFGALDENSIAWKVAERCVEEGAKITLTNVPVALRFGGIKVLAEKLGAEIIPADATKEEDLENYRHSELFQNIWAETKVFFNDKPLAWSVDKVVSLT